MEEEKVTPSVTLDELNQLVNDLFKKKLEVEKKEAEKKLLNRELAALKAKAVTYLKDHGMKKYKLEDVGTISIANKWNITLPKGEDKLKTFEWLKEKGIFEQYATFNASSFKSMWLAQREAAIERGELMEFSVPGVADATLFEDIGMRKA